MDHDHFDGLARSLGAAASRRGLVRALAGGGLGTLLGVAFGALDADAKKNRGKKKKKTRRRNRRPPVTATPPPPGLVLTYQCSGPKTDSLSSDGANRFAQTFIAERSGSLRQIQFSIEKRPATTGDYLVQLLKVIGGTPSHSPTDVLAALTVPDAAVATSSDATLTATFAGPALVAGTEYAAAFSRPGTGPGGAGANYRKGDGSACGGKWFNADGTGVFLEATAQDILVSVLVT